MLDRIQKRKESGFTIVEVMIVLAIAGLIILVVFLAVPALQRNSRNQQRNNDASLIGSAINECLNNRNGRTLSCDAFGATPVELESYVNLAELRQLTTNVTANPTAGQMNHFRIWFGRECNADNSNSQPGNARSVVLLYNIESTAGTGILRCQEV